MSDSAKAVTTPDGRRLTYLEVGDPDGPLVIHNHGGPSSRLEARLFADAASKNRLRLICVDRPGMGQSSPQKTRTLLRLGRRLDDDRRRVGVPRIRRDGLVGGWPMGTRGSCLHRSRSTAPRQQHRAWKLRSIRRQLGSAITFRRSTRWADPSHCVSNPASASCTRPSASPPNTSARPSSNNCATPSTTTIDRFCFGRRSQPRFSDACAECFAHGSDGLVRDAELLYRSWAFDVAAIERRVHMWQGLDDRLVPDPINKAVADAMPGAVWHPVDGSRSFCGCR